MFKQLEWWWIEVSLWWFKMIMAQSVSKNISSKKKSTLLILSRNDLLNLNWASYAAKFQSNNQCIPTAFLIIGTILWCHLCLLHMGKKQMLRAAHHYQYDRAPSAAYGRYGKTTFHHGPAAVLIVWTPDCHLLHQPLRTILATSSSLYTNQVRKWEQEKLGCTLLLS